MGLAKSPEARADALAAYDAYRSNSTNETTVTPADVSPSQSGVEDIHMAVHILGRVGPESSGFGPLSRSE